MVRIIFELLPGGNEATKRTIGLMEIANIKMNGDGTADYSVIMKKTPPFKGSLRNAWRNGVVKDGDDILSGTIHSHHRQKRGVYDLLYKAMKALGMGERND